jgi:hypothetical protein
MDAIVCLVLGGGRGETLSVKLDSLSMMSFNSGLGGEREREREREKEREKEN